MSQRNVLYRFYGDGDALLYIGITMNAPARFGQHRDDKPWWGDITRIDMEHFNSREEVLEAERAAIVAERPAHNVVHNRGVQRPSHRVSGEPAGLLLQPGDYVAIGMSDGKCPVGYVDFVDDQWVTLILKSWLTGCYDLERRSYRMDKAEHITYAQKINDGLVDDDHFAAFQTEWINAHRTVTA